MAEVPQAVKEVGFDFDWEPKKVWALKEPVTTMGTDELTWHFDIPFLWERGFAVTPRAIMEDPLKHPQEYARTLSADTSHPIDIMENKGRWLILDGLHRLMKLHAQGERIVAVRKIPRSRISEIVK